MRTSLIGLAVAAAVGTSALALPSAVAAHTAPAATAQHVSAAAARVVPVSAAISTVPQKQRPCAYPTTKNTLSLAPARARFPHAVRITFHGRLAHGKCAVRGHGVRLFSTHGVGGRTVTDARGFYSISVKVTRTTAFIAAASKPAVFSNPAVITIAAKHH